MDPRKLYVNTVTDGNDLINDRKLIEISLETSKGSDNLAEN